MVILTKGFSVDSGVLESIICPLWSLSWPPGWGGYSLPRKTLTCSFLLLKHLSHSTGFLFYVYAFSIKPEVLREVGYLIVPEIRNPHMCLIHNNSNHSYYMHQAFRRILLSGNLLRYHKKILSLLKILSQTLSYFIIRSTETFFILNFQLTNMFNGPVNEPEELR